jgi:hypothetical protein
MTDVRHNAVRITTATVIIVVFDTILRENKRMMIGGKVVRVSREDGD